MEFKLGVRTGVSPGTNDFGTDKNTHSIGWRGTRSVVTIVVLTGGDDVGRVVEVGEADKRMGGTLNEQCLIDQGTEPGQNEGEKAVKEGLDEGWQVREGGGRVGDRRW